MCGEVECTPLEVAEVEQVVATGIVDKTPHPALAGAVDKVLAGRCFGVGHAAASVGHEIVGGRAAVL
jgi:hypothetical protein